MSETELQRHARWQRERAVDEVAIHLGLAHQTRQHGICYWNFHAGEAFRKGYEAGLAAPRAPQDVALHPWGRYLAARKDAIHHYRTDGRSFAEIAELLNLTNGDHVQRIYEATAPNVDRDA